jgi:hypothetical protein
VHDRRAGAAAKVVAVEGDVEVAERDVGAEQLVEEALQASGEKRATAVDADEREQPGLGRLLHDLVRDPQEGAPHVVLVEDDLRVGHGLQVLLSGLTGPV